MGASTSDGKRIATYAEFWPFYLGEHAKPETRRWHFFGTLLSTLFLGLALVTRNAWWLPAALVAGYGPAWIGHFFAEKNQPAIFKYPLWSLASDYRMTWTWLMGRLENELEKAGVQGSETTRR